MNKVANIKLYNGLILTLSKTFTKSDVSSFSNLIGDKNNLHLSEEAAKNSRFKEPICQGLLVGSLFSNLMGNNFPMSIYLSQSFNFKAPVYIGEEVKSEIIVKDIKNKVLKLKTTVYKKNKTKAIEGEALLLIDNINEYL